MSVPRKFDSLNSIGCYLERVEELDDVGGRSDVDEEELRELIAGEVTLGEHPPADDEDEHEELLDDHHEGVVVHRDRNVLQVNRNLVEEIASKI